MGLIGDAIESFSPCDEHVLSMNRIIGGRPQLENYWDGTFYLKKWPTLSEVRISLTVDNPAKIELDPNLGRVLVTDVCKNPIKWEPTILGSGDSVSETETEEKIKPTCGRRLVKHEGLITNGFESKEGDWPWLVSKKKTKFPEGNSDPFVFVSGTQRFFT
ncbi:hypothetical protein HA402_012328 [Bradysia odoriphaga]|nr:hypothetical protein HA402_012328 [Bradysia odoriphaga]